MTVFQKMREMLPGHKEPSQADLESLEGFEDFFAELDSDLSQGDETIGEYLDAHAQEEQGQ